MMQQHTRPLLELLVQISRDVATVLDLRTVLQRVLFASLQYVGGERGSIVVMDDLGKPVDATIVYGRQFHEHTTQQLRETVERGLAGWVIHNRKPAILPDTSKDPRWLRRADDAVEQTGAKSAICVPLIARERLVGVLTLVHPTPNSFTDDHLGLMQAIADQTSVAVLNARLYHESQRTARVMTALADGAAAINTSLEMSDVWRRILNQTMQALQVETVALALIDGDTSDLVFRAAAGRNSEFITDRRIPDGQGLAGRVVREGSGMVIPSVRQEPAYGETDKIAGIDIRALAIAPIQFQGRVIGVLEAINPISGRFDPDALVVMYGLGSLAGTTIQNAELFEQLQKAHQHYRELFEDSIDPIFISDWNGKVLETNRRAAALSGYSREELLSTHVGKLHEINWSRTGLNFDLLRNGDVGNYEAELKCKDGGRVPIEVHARRVEFDDTDSIQWILRDITARKELDALRDDMTSMIYHDIRSPLGNVVSSLEMMSTAVNGNELLISMLSIAQNSTARINRLVNSLLDINRLESGKQLLDQNAVNPFELICEVLHDVQPSAKGRAQTLINTAINELPPIWVDVDMIHRMLINLMENAIKFTPVGGTIEIGAQATNDSFVMFWVRDTGPGIPAADQSLIFEKFTRIRGKNRAAGLGMGLAFCRLATIAHGGSIWVESENNNGATFRLTMPIADKKPTGQLKRQTGKLTIKPGY